MPILPAEAVLYPEGLFADLPSLASDRAWWVLHTRPRQEKCLARILHERECPFYLPVVPRRGRVRGRLVTAQLPLFAGYLFLLGNDRERVAALATQRVVQALPVCDQTGLWRDLQQVQRLIDSGSPITPEGRLLPGVRVEICSGPLTGLTGKIIRTAARGKRFVIEVDFIQRGASVELDDFTLRRLMD